jgi:hypothetical protein
MPSRANSSSSSSSSAPAPAPVRALRSAGPPAPSDPAVPAAPAARAPLILAVPRPEPDGENGDGQPVGLGVRFAAGRKQPRPKKGKRSRAKKSKKRRVEPDEEDSSEDSSSEEGDSDSGSENDSEKESEEEEEKEDNHRRSQIRKASKIARKNKEALASFEDSIKEVTSTDYVKAFSDAVANMTSSGAVVRLDKAAIHAAPETLVRLLGYCHLNGKDELVQVSNYDSILDRYTVVVVRDHTRWFTVAKCTMQHFGATHTCTLAPLKDVNEELPVSDLPPKGVSLVLTEDGKTALLNVGTFSGPQEQVLITSRLKGTERAEDHDHGVRHSDPTKPHINELPGPTVKTLFKQGTYSNSSISLSNRTVSDVLATIKDGGLQEMSLSGGKLGQELLIGLSKQQCLHALGFRIMDLAHFRSLPQGTDVFQAHHDAKPLSETERKLLSVTEVGAMITNAKVLFNRLFGLSDLLFIPWSQLFTQMQEEMSGSERSMPLLKQAWVQLILFNKLFNRFFAVVTHPDITEELILRELHYFRIVSTDAWMIEEYDYIERIVTQELMASLQHQHNGRRQGAPGGVNALPGAPAGRVAGPRGHNKEAYCFSFFATIGCSRAKCHFKHKWAAGATPAIKDQFKAEIVARGLVPDATKF